MLCDKKEDLLEELALLKDVFLSNGYPEKLVLKTLEDSWAKETLKAVLKGVEQKVKVEKPKENYFEVLHAPYVKGFSEGLQRRLRRLQVGFVPKSGETIYSNVCRLKQRVDVEERKNVVYAVPCGDCGIRYFGETGQHFSDRKSQHQRDVKAGKTTNGFFCHVKENAGHKIDWESAVFVDYEKNWKRRKIKEAIYINAINPTKAIRKKGILNLEKGYDLDAIWSEFNGVLRNSIAKKVGRAV